MKQGISILPSCDLSGCFLGTASLDFSEFWHVARNPYEVVHDNPIFGKTFCPRIEEIGPKKAKVGFFEFKEKFGH